MVALTQREWLVERAKVVKESITVFKLLSDLGINLKHEDRPQQITCVFKVNHSNEDRKKSARVFPDSNGYYCYVCTPKPIDIIRFMMVHENLKFRQALEWLERKYKIDPGEPILKKELVDELEDILHPKTEKKDDVKKFFDYAEILLRRNRDSMLMKDYVDIFWLRDEILFDFEQGRLSEDKALENIEKIIKKIKKVSNAGHPSVQLDRQV